MDRSLFHRKIRVMAAVEQWMAALQSRIEDDLSTTELPERFLQKSAKLSRGENHHGQPWMLLDHPAMFLKEEGSPEIWACRTFFCWGQGLSLILQLHGQTVPQGTLTAPEGWQLNIEGDPWDYREEGSWSPRLEAKDAEWLRVRRMVSLGDTHSLLEAGASRYSEAWKWWLENR